MQAVLFALIAFSSFCDGFRVFNHRRLKVFRKSVAASVHDEIDTFVTTKQAKSALISIAQHTESDEDIIHDGIIVGAGPIGLSTAILLVQKGYKDIHIFDRLPPPPSSPSNTNTSYFNHLGPHQVNPRQYCIGITGRGQLGLQSLGVWEHFIAPYTIPLTTNIEYPPDSNQPIPRQIQRKYLPCSIERDRLTACLFQFLQQSSQSLEDGHDYSSCITYHWSTQITNFALHHLGSDQEYGTVVYDDNSLGLSQQEEGGEDDNSSSNKKKKRLLSGRLVVGCDGSGSALRSCAIDLATKHNQLVRRAAAKQRQKRAEIETATSSKGWFHPVLEAAREDDERNEQLDPAPSEEEEDESEEQELLPALELIRYPENKRSEQVYLTFPLLFPPSSDKKNCSYSFRSAGNIGMNIETLPTVSRPIGGTGSDSSDSYIHLAVLLFSPYNPIVLEWTERLQQARRQGGNNDRLVEVIEEEILAFFHHHFPALQPSPLSSPASTPTSGLTMPALQRMLSTLTSSQGAYRFPRFSYLAQSYHLSSSVVFLGDSVHSVKPYFGLGVNSGLEDVLVLGKVLPSYSAIAASNEGMKAALASYSQQRVPQGKAVVETSHRIDNNFFLFFVLPLLIDQLFLRYLSSNLYTGSPPLTSCLQDEKLLYTEAIQIKQRDRLTQSMVALGVVGLVAGTATWLLPLLSMLQHQYP